MAERPPGKLGGLLLGDNTEIPTSTSMAQWGSQFSATDALHTCWPDSARFVNVLPWVVIEFVLAAHDSLRVLERVWEQVCGVAKRSRFPAP